MNSPGKQQECVVTVTNISEIRIFFQRNYQSMFLLAVLRKLEKAIYLDRKYLASMLLYNTLLKWFLTFQGWSDPQITCASRNQYIV